MVATSRSVPDMITNISIVGVFVKDVDESKRFYTDVLGFEAKDDITLGGGYRWCTVVHPNQPELMVNLTVPGPPHAPQLVEAMKRALDEGGMHGLGLNVDDCQATFEERRVHPAAIAAPVRHRGVVPRQLRKLARPGAAHRSAGRCRGLRARDGIVTPAAIRSARSDCSRATYGHLGRSGVGRILPLQVTSGSQQDSDGDRRCLPHGRDLGRPWRDSDPDALGRARFRPPVA
jgi:catechol 2,3-dioxygenase-like lactoylglutathione lyase family enzyme